MSLALFNHVGVKNFCVTDNSYCFVGWVKKKGALYCSYGPEEYYVDCKL